MSVSRRTDPLGKEDLGLLFGILPKQKQPFLPPLRWICKWPEKSPVSSALRQQRHRWLCYTLLEIPTRCWSLRRRFMQHKPPHTIDCHAALQAAFVKGRLNQIDTVYSICPRIHKPPYIWVSNGDVPLGETGRQQVNHIQGNKNNI